MLIFKGVKQSAVALIQIATERGVYIFDVITMGQEYKDLWVRMGPALFENKNIVKLGKNQIPAHSASK